MVFARSIIIGLVTTGILTILLAGDEISALTERPKYGMNEADNTYICASDRTTPCFEQGGQRAVYDLAKGQAKYFLFGFASAKDKRDARLKSFGLIPTFAGCVIRQEGFKDGYNFVIKKALARLMSVQELDPRPDFISPSREL